MDLRDSLTVAAAGMKVQGTRIKVIAENMANSDSTAANPPSISGSGTTVSPGAGQTLRAKMAPARR